MLTVENQTQYYNHYDLQGYFVLRNYFNPAEIAALRTVILKFHQAWKLDNAEFYQQDAFNSSLITAGEYLGYEDFLHMKILEFPGSTRECIAWAMSRDRQTRASARDLYLHGWPWGGAMSEARERKCAVLWTVGNASPCGALVAMLSEHVAAAGHSGSRLATTSKSDAPCPYFNQASGCSQKQRDCRDGLKHKCSYQIPGKGECGRCPLNPNCIQAKRDRDRQGPAAPLDRERDGKWQRGSGRNSRKGDRRR